MALPTPVLCLFPASSESGGEEGKTVPKERKTVPKEREERKHVYASDDDWETHCAACHKLVRAN